MYSEHPAKIKNHYERWRTLFRVIESWSRLIVFQGGFPFLLWMDWSLHIWDLSSLTLHGALLGLSPYIKFGCLSVRTAWHAIEQCIRGKTHSEPPQSLHGQWPGWTVTLWNRRMGARFLIKGRNNEPLHFSKAAFPGDVLPLGGSSTKLRSERGAPCWRFSFFVYHLAVQVTILCGSSRAASKFCISLATRFFHLLLDFQMIDIERHIWGTRCASPYHGEIARNCFKLGRLCAHICC